MSQKEYSQNELQQFFYHQMNEFEKQQIIELDMANEIQKIRKPRFDVKYIENVGYMFIGEGYLILKNHIEELHYFCDIYTDRNAFVSAIEHEAHQ